MKIGKRLRKAKSDCETRKGESGTKLETEKELKLKQKLKTLKLKAKRNAKLKQGWKLKTNVR